MAHHPVDAADDVGVGAGAVRRKGPDRNQVGSGGDAVEVAGGGGQAGEDDAGDVGAVARIVGVTAGRLEVILDRVVAGQHPRLAGGV